MTNRGFLATAAVGAALLTGGCGGGDNQTADGTKPKADIGAAALKFSRCMRAHGVNMPDPEISSDGSKVRVRVGGAKGTAKFNPQSPAFKSAEQACRKYMEAVRPKLTPAQRQEAQQQVLETLRCMRRHGIDIPDSAAAGDGGLRIGPDTGVNPDDPAFQRAQQACTKGKPSGLAMGSSKP